MVSSRAVLLVAVGAAVFVLVAAVAVVLFPEATAGEVQALGGLIGLAGMGNYFLRPVYRLVYGVGRRLAGV